MSPNNGDESILEKVLSQLNLTDLLPVFQENEIDDQTFLELTNDDLKDIGISKLGQRKKILGQIKLKQGSLAGNDNSNDSAGNEEVAAIENAAVIASTVAAAQAAIEKTAMTAASAMQAAVAPPSFGQLTSSDAMVDEPNWDVPSVDQSDLIVNQEDLKTEAERLLSAGETKEVKQIIDTWLDAKIGPLKIQTLLKQSKSYNKSSTSPLADIQPSTPIEANNISVTIVAAVERPLTSLVLDTFLEQRNTKKKLEPWRLPIAHAGKQNDLKDPWQVQVESPAAFHSTVKSHTFEDTRIYGQCGKCEGRRTFRCDTCSGQRELSCNGCAGAGKLRCGKCNGAGRRTCGNCSGRGQVKCGSLMRTGMFDHHSGTSNQRCSKCGGFETPLQVPCKKCANGQINCSTCFQSGQVDCSSCVGRGRVTCHSCDGRGENDCSLCEAAGNLSLVQTAVVNFHVESTKETHAPDASLSADSLEKMVFKPLGRAAPGANRQSELPKHLNQLPVHLIKDIFARLLAGDEEGAAEQLCLYTGIVNVKKAQAQIKNAYKTGFDESFSAYEILYLVGEILSSFVDFNMPSGTITFGKNKSKPISLKKYSSHLRKKSNRLMPATLKGLVSTDDLAAKRDEMNAKLDPEFTRSFGSAEMANKIFGEVYNDFDHLLWVYLLSKQLESCSKIVLFGEVVNWPLSSQESSDLASWTKSIAKKVGLPGKMFLPVAALGKAWKVTGVLELLVRSPLDDSALATLNHAVETAKTDSNIKYGLFGNFAISDSQDASPAKTNENLLNGGKIEIERTRFESGDIQTILGGTSLEAVAGELIALERIDIDIEANNRILRQRLIGNQTAYYFVEYAVGDKNKDKNYKCILRKDPNNGIEICADSTPVDEAMNNYIYACEEAINNFYHGFSFAAKVKRLNELGRIETLIGAAYASDPGDFRVYELRKMLDKKAALIQESNMLKWVMWGSLGAVGAVVLPMLLGLFLFIFVACMAGFIDAANTDQVKISNAEFSIDTIEPKLADFPRNPIILGDLSGDEIYASFAQARGEIIQCGQSNWEWLPPETPLKYAEVVISCSVSHDGLHVDCEIGPNTLQNPAATHSCLIEQFEAMSFVGKKSGTHFTLPLFFAGDTVWLNCCCEVCGEHPNHEWAWRSFSEGMRGKAAPPR